MDEKISAKKSEIDSAVKEKRILSNLFPITNTKEMILFQELYPKQNRKFLR